MDLVDYYKLKIIIQRHGIFVDKFKKGDFEIIIECKQYENSSLTIRNLIHQWSDKNSEIKADRIILVLYGMSLKETDINLATSRNIILWDEQTLQRYTSLTIKDKEEASKKLGGFSPSSHPMKTKASYGQNTRTPLYFRASLIKISLA